MTQEIVWDRWTIQEQVAQALSQGDFALALEMMRWDWDQDKMSHATPPGERLRHLQRVWQALAQVHPAARAQLVQWHEEAMAKLNEVFDFYTFDDVVILNHILDQEDKTTRFLRRLNEGGLYTPRNTRIACSLIDRAWYLWAQYEAWDIIRRCPPDVASCVHASVYAYKAVDTDLVAHQAHCGDENTAFLHTRLIDLLEAMLYSGCDDHVAMLQHTAALYDELTPTLISVLHDRLAELERHDLICR